MNSIKGNADSPRTKIVCTLGPASSDEKTLRGMIEAGMSVARINLSHGQHANHAKRIELVRRLAEETGHVVAIMGDLQGPKVRIGRLENEPLVLDEDSEYILTSSPDAAGSHVIPVPQPEIIRGAQVGNVVWLRDGLLELTVVAKAPDELRCRVVVGGPLFSNQGISVPGVQVDIPSITSKDRQDLEFAVAQEVDYVAMSFVRTADDIQELRHLINGLGASIPVVAKVEHPEALDNLDRVIEASDAVMVARGDLGVEGIFEEVPAHQIRIIRICNQAARPVITATQMLHSMTHSSHPTRAEANDVFTSVLQGSDAVMLSSETAIGEHPVRAVKSMAKIAHMAEQYFPHRTWSADLGEEGTYSITEGIGEATCGLAANLGAEAILTNTLSGRTTRKVAKHRPQSRIISTTPDEETHRRMALVWGVESLVVPKFYDTDEMITGVKRSVARAGLVKPGDRVVITGGVPGARSVQVHTIEDDDVA